MGGALTDIIESFGVNIEHKRATNILNKEIGRWSKSFELKMIQCAVFENKQDDILSLVEGRRFKRSVTLYSLEEILICDIVGVFEIIGVTHREELGEGFFMAIGVEYEK